MSRSQWIVISVLGLAVAIVCGLLGGFSLLYLTDRFPTQSSAPVQPSDTPTPPSTYAATEPTAPPSCELETVGYLAQLEPLLVEFGDTTELADSTARIALSPLVHDMQSTRRHLADIPAPDCAQGASALLTSGMEHIINAFVAFMRDDWESTIQVELEHGELKMTAGLEQLTALAAGQPTPTPIPTPTISPAGKAIVIRNWRIRVERIEIADALTSRYSDETERAVGRFALLFMALTNLGPHTDSFQAYTGLEIQDGQGRRYQQAFLASSYAETQHNTDNHVVRPGETAHTVDVFDISKHSSSYMLVSAWPRDWYAPRVFLNVPP